MTDNPTPLLEARLNYVYRSPFSILELKAFKDPKKRNDPKIQREIRAQYLDTMWRAAPAAPDPVKPVTASDEPLALSVLRSARESLGSAADLSHMSNAPPESDEGQELSSARAAGWALGVVPMQMTDRSALVYDALTDHFSAWVDWPAALRSLTARRELGAGKAPECSVAEAIRWQIQEGHLPEAYTSHQWFSEERRRSIAQDVDRNMDDKTLRAFLNVHICPMMDGSIFVVDMNISDGWRSAADGNSCTQMLQLGYAPHRLDKWWRQHLIY